MQVAAPDIWTVSCVAKLNNKNNLKRKILTEIIIKKWSENRCACKTEKMCNKQNLECVKHFKYQQIYIRCTIVHIEQYKNCKSKTLGKYT